MKKYDKSVYDKVPLPNTIIDSNFIYEDMGDSKQKKWGYAHLEFIELVYLDNDLAVCTKRFKYKEMRNAIKSVRKQDDRRELISSYIGELDEFSNITPEAYFDLKHALVNGYKQTTNTPDIIKDELSKIHLTITPLVPSSTDSPLNRCCVQENIDIISSKKGTFDYIYVWVFIPSDLSNLEFVKEHKAEFDQMVLDKLHNTRAFAKFNVPDNFLKIERITLRGNDLEYVVGLKMNEIE